MPFRPDQSGGQPPPLPPTPGVPKGGYKDGQLSEPMPLESTQINAADRITQARTSILDSLTGGVYSKQQNVFDRARRVPLQSAPKFPSTLAGTIFSGVPENLISNVAYSLEGSQIYFDQLHNVAGLPGALTAAYGYTYNIADPMKRKEAQDFLGTIQALPPDKQLVVWNTLTTGGDVSKLGDALGWNKAPSVTDIAAINALFPKADPAALSKYSPSFLHQLFGLFDFSQPGNIIDRLGSYGSNLTSSLVQAQANNLFSGGPTAPWNPAQQISARNQLPTVGQAIIGSGTLFAGATGGIAKGGGILARGLIPGHIGKQSVGGLVSRGISDTAAAGNAAFSIVERSAQDALLYPTVVSQWASNALTGQDNFNIWNQLNRYAPSLTMNQANVGKMNEPLVQYAIDNLGWTPGQNQGTVDAANIATQLGFTSLVAGSFAAAHEAAIEPYMTSTGVNYTNPLAGFIKATTGLAPEEWVYSKEYSKIMSDIVKIQEDPKLAGDPEAIAGQITKTIKYMDPKLAEKLAIAQDPVSMQQIFIDHMRNIPTADKIASLTEQTSTIDRLIAENRDAGFKAQEAVPQDIIQGATDVGFLRGEGDAFTAGLDIRTEHGGPGAPSEYQPHILDGYFKVLGRDTMTVDETGTTVPVLDIQYVDKAGNPIPIEIWPGQEPYTGPINVTPSEFIGDLNNPVATVGGVDEAALAKLEAEGLRLRGVRQDLQNQLSDMENKFPVYKYPKASAYRRLISDEPTNPFERFLTDLYHKQPFRLTSFADHIPSWFQLINPGATADWLIRDSEYVTKLMRLARVPEEMIAKAIGELAKVRDEVGLYDWTQTLGDYFKEGVTRGGTKSINPILLDRIMRIFDNPVETRMGTIIHETTPPDAYGYVDTTYKAAMRRPSDVNPAAPIPQPAMSAEQLSSETRITLPSYDTIKDASSAIRRWQFEGSAANKASMIQRAIRAPYNVVAKTLEIAARTMKPLILVPRVPALLTRIQIDEMASNAAFGYKAFMMPDGFRNFVPALGKVLYDSPVGQYLWGEDGLFPHEYGLGVPNPSSLATTPQAGDIGAIGGFLDNSSTPNWARDMAPKSTAKFINNPALFATSPEAGPMLNGLTDQYGRIMASPEMKVLARYGPDSTEIWFQSDPWAVHYYDNALKGRLDRAGYGLDQHLAYLDQHLQEITGGMDTLRQGLATGKIPDGFSIDPKAQAIFDSAMSKLKAADLGLKEGEAANLEPNLMDYLQTERYNALREVEAARKNIITNKYIDMRDTAAVQAYIKNAVVNGDFKLPPNIMVDVSRQFTETKTIGAYTHMLESIDAFNNMMYRGLGTMGTIDMKLARGSLWKEAYNEEYTKLIDQGWEGERASAIATARAGSIVRDLHYNLNEPTSFHRDIQNVFWFAPAWQRILSTWLVKVPSTYYWPVGMSFLANRVELLAQAFRDTGLIKKVTGPDGKPQEIVSLNFIADFLNKFGANIPGFVYAKPTGFSLGTAGLPGLAPLPDFLLGRASEKWGGVFKALSAALQPHGPDSIPGSQSLYDGWEAIFGSKPPWSGLSGQYGQDVYDRARDQAIQYAYDKLVSEGKLPPNIADYSHYLNPATGHLEPSAADGMKFKKANAQWWADLNQEADSVFHGMAIGKYLGATIFPASLYPTTAEKVAWQKFYQSQVIPAGFDPTGGYSQHQKDLIASYVNQHPGSMAYATSYTVSGDKAKPMPYSQSQSSAAYYDKLRNGELKVLDPEQYMMRLQALTSQQHYRATLTAAWNSAGTTWQSQLKNGYKASQAVLQAQQLWDSYLKYNPQIKGYLDQGYLDWAAKYGVDSQGLASDQASQLLHLMKENGNYFIGAGGLHSTDYKTVVAKLGQLVNDTVQFGKPTTAIAKAKNAWYNKVLTPYWNKVGPLYDQANTLKTEGLDATAVYAKITKIQNAYNNNPALTTTQYGKGPTPEQYHWGTLNPQERQNAIVAWESEPPGWLSDFALKKTGMPNTKDAQKGYKIYNDITTSFYAWMDKNHVSTSSNLYKAAVASRDKQIMDAAKAVGPQAVKAVQLSSGAPIVRLAYSGYGSHSPLFTDMTSLVKTATQQFISAGVSPKGYSLESMPDKVYIEQLINYYRTPTINGQPNPDYSPQFDNLWAALGRANPLPGKDTREGVLLYEAVLFGQYNPLAYGLRDLVTAVNNVKYTTPKSNVLTSKP